MPQKTMRLALDLSVLAANPLTGVGVHSLNLFKTFIASHTEFDCRIFASTARPVYEHLNELIPLCTKTKVLHFPTRLKALLWTSLEWPPIEWFTGPADIAYGGFHLLPASRCARRTAFIFDVAWRRFPNTNTPSSNALHERFTRHAAHRADALLAMSQNTKQDLVEYYGVDSERIHVVYGGIDLDSFTQPLDQEQLKMLKKTHGIRDPYFIYIGNLEPRKNLPRVLEAYARMRDRSKECPQFVMVGPQAWLFRPIFETIERLGLQNQIICTGFLSHEKAMCLLRGALACVYVTLYEGFGLPVLEAMAARVPVLTANVSSIPEVIGEDGLLVDPLDAEAIAEGFADLLENPDGARARAAAAFERAKSFTWKNSADALARVFHTLVP